jgi:mRNA (guanine-N7-)-methyltransferase
MFDCVSVQFALHYAFESESKIRQFLKTISNHLYHGGKFFGTIPYSPYLMNFLQNLGPEFGNTVYKVEFADSAIRTYGQKYVFTLVDAIDSCPEYVVHSENFYMLCKEYGLVLDFHTPFHQYFYEQIDNHGAESLDLIRRMSVFDSNGDISKAEWDASGIYSVFCFTKRS